MRIVRTTLQAATSAAFTLALFLGGPIGAVIAGTATPMRVEAVPVRELSEVYYLPAPELEADANGDDAVHEGGDGGTGSEERRAGPVREQPKGDRPAVGGQLERPGRQGVVRERPGPQRSRKCLDPTASIQEMGVDRFDVERDFVETYTRDFSRMNTLGRVTQHDGPDGKPDGFQIRRIRCGNPLHQGGLRNGDVIHSVNGKPVRNLVQALAAYSKLKKRDVIRVDVTRDGQHKRLVYRLT